jgi:hypothetical protein
MGKGDTREIADLMATIKSLSFEEKLQLLAFLRAINSSGQPLDPE